MKINKWTLGLAAMGVVGLSSVAQAEEHETPLLTALSATTLSGYVDTSAIWRPGTGKDATSVGRSYDASDRHDGFNVNVVSLSLDKPLDESAWSAGYHVQAIIGPDVMVRGTRTLAGGSAGDLGLNEAYVALSAPVGNGIQFKMGQFVTPIGYESFDGYKNPNYSRSYGYFLEPSSHVGIQANYTITEAISILAAVANSYSPALDARAATESVKTHMAMITFTAPEDLGFLAGSTLSAGYINGTVAGGTDHTENIYLGGTLATPVAGLSLGFAYDYQEDLFPGSHASAYALYASMAIGEKLKLNARGEYATGSVGTLGYGPGENELVGLTLTADYALWQNVVSRVEGRYDRDLNHVRPYGNSDRNLFTLAFNVIYKF